MPYPIIKENLMSRIKKILTEYHKRVREIIDLSGYLLEPEVQTYLNKLERNMDNILALSEREGGFLKATEDKPLLSFVYIGEIKNCTDQIVDLMIKKCSTTIPMEEKYKKHNQNNNLKKVAKKEVKKEI